jgi:hypothetical protein
VHSIISSARTSSVERISMPSFAVLQTNAGADPLFDPDQGWPTGQLLTLEPARDLAAFIDMPSGSAPAD